MSIIAALIAAGLVWLIFRWGVGSGICWTESLLEACINVSAIICAFDLMHREVIMYHNSDFAEKLRNSAYNSYFHYLALVPTFLSLVFISICIILMLLYCSQENGDKRVHLINTQCWTMLWVGVASCMVVSFLIVHKLCLKIMRMENPKLSTRSS